MTGAYLARQQHRGVARSRPFPEPGHGEVLLRMKASTICGSDIRCIYHEHLGKGPEGYQGVIAGHEPCGQIVKTGPGCRRFGEGDRVIVYHISGCGVCNDCRRGYMISCTSEQYRRAYGWQRDGGMADFLLAEEKDLIHLPGRALLRRRRAGGLRLRHGLRRAAEDRHQRQRRGADHRPRTGRAWPPRRSAASWARTGSSASTCVEERMRLARDLGLCDEVLAERPGQCRARCGALTGGTGVERAVDCSANDAARATAIRATRKWGRIVFLGEGGRVEFNPSPDIIHDQKTHLRVVGDLDLADGGAGGAAGALEPASRRPGDAPLRAGSRGGRVRPDGVRQMRQGRRLFRRRVGVKVAQALLPAPQRQQNKMALLEASDITKAFAGRAGAQGRVVRAARGRGACARRRERRRQVHPDQGDHRRRSRRIRGHARGGGPGGGAQ